MHLQPGDAVRVRNFDRDGRIVRLRLEQQRAEVNVGAFAVEVPLGDVLPPETPPPPPRSRQSTTSLAITHKQRKQTNPSKPQQAPKGPGKQHPDRPTKRRTTPPELPSLTEEQAARLNPGDMVYMKRFQRQGRVVRLKPAKKLIIVSAGLLEVEVPYSGLALPPSRTPRRDS